MGKIAEENYFYYIYEKTFSLPFVHRLDELLKRNCETAKSEPVKIGNANSLTGSNQSSHSPSFTGESLDVKVEITPAPPSMCDIQGSYSIESTSSLTICSDASSKSLATSPNIRKFSEVPHESGNFLNPIGNFNRSNPSPPNSASGRLFKKIEEMIDLSSPYNHYRCLSPSETNLSIPHTERSHSVSPSNSKTLDLNKPGSSRLLRRQFSLDKDDLSAHKHGNVETISSFVDSKKHSTIKSQSYLPLVSSSSLPSGSTLIGGKLHKHQSISVAQDLEKIEEIPISPNSSLDPKISLKDLNSFRNSNSNNNVKTPSQDNKEFSVNIC